MSEVLNKSENKAISVTDAGKEVADGGHINNVGRTGDAGNSGSGAESSPKLHSPEAENKKTPAKKTPSKRMSFIERAQKESEELVKTMGGILELEGGRRTRSSTRGTPSRPTPVTPPPAKKARNSPAATTNSATPRARGRGRKLNTSTEEEKVQEQTDVTVEKENIVTNNKESFEESSTEKTDCVDGGKNVVETIVINDNGKVEETPKEHSKEVIAAEKENDKDSNKISVSEPSSSASNENIGNGLKKSEKKSDKIQNQGSPMDTDEVAETTDPSEAVLVSKSNDEEKKSDKSEATVATPGESVLGTGKQESKKEPTPEPMEVDSVSKSSNDDVKETNVSKNKSDEDVESKSPSENKNATSSKSEVASADSSSIPTVVIGDSSSDEVDSTQKDQADEEKTDVTVNAAKSSSERNDTEVKTNSSEVLEKNDTVTLENKVISSEKKTEDNLSSKIVKETIETAVSVGTTATVNNTVNATATATSTTISTAASSEGAIATPQSCN